MGESSFSAEFELEQLSLSGALPLEVECILCHRPTTNQAKYLVTCEVATVDTGELPLWQKVLSVAAFGLIGVLVLGASQVRKPSIRGRDVILLLPIRACPECVQTLTTPSAVREAMKQTPIYARLFEKYPQAAICNAG